MTDEECIADLNQYWPQRIAREPIDRAIALLEREHLVDDVKRLFPAGSTGNSAPDHAIRRLVEWKP